MSVNSIRQTVEQSKSWVADKIKKGIIKYKRKNNNPVNPFETQR
jgi:hypothetical protein